MALNNTPCQVNSATSIDEPGTTTDGFGVKTTRYIYVVAATASFLDGLNPIVGTTVNPDNLAVNFGNNPYRVANGAGVPSATVGTIWYYIE